MTEIKLTMVRHGQTRDNIEGIYSHSGVSLSSLGKNQILKLKDKLSEYNFGEVYYSPHKRTRESFDLLGVDGKADYRIAETNFGIFTGKTYEDICLQYPKESSLWFQEYLNYRIPAGESLMDVYDRIDDFIKDLNNDTLIISHEGVIRIILSWVFDEPEYFYKFKIQNASISQIIIGEDYKMISKISELG